jgi:exopolysaccharide biosynthesis polyprenyl glycosylphosphotransferase
MHSKESQAASSQAQPTGALSAARVSRSVLALWNRRGIVLLGMDLFCIVISFLVAYDLRFYLDWLTAAIPPPIETAPPPDPYSRVAVVTAMVWVFLLWKDRSYSKAPHFSKPLARQVQDVLTNGMYATVFLMAMSFMIRYFLLSRLVYGMAMFLAASALVGIRASFTLMERHLTRRGLLFNRVLLLGWDLNGESLADRLQQRSPATAIVGRLISGANTARGSVRDGLIPVLGTAEDIEKVYQQTPFDQLIVGSHWQDVREGDLAYPDAMICALNFCERNGVPVYMVPDFLDVAVRSGETGSLAGIPFIRLQDSSLHPVYFWVKRIMDISLSLLVVVAGMPLWLVIALLIKLTGKGPMLYIQERAGLYGKPFRLYKFRSMVHCADQMLRDLVDLSNLQEPVFNIRQDPRITPFGKFLRRTSMDEIPQFFNVLTGSMSIVGPRPERVELVERYDPFQRRRLKAKPGITGYQQVMSRGDPSLSKRIEYDLYYLKYQNLSLDLFIMAKTLLVVVRGDGMK